MMSGWSALRTTLTAAAAAGATGGALGAAFYGGNVAQGALIGAGVSMALAAAMYGARQVVRNVREQHLKNEFEEALIELDTKLNEIVEKGASQEQDAITKARKAELKEYLDKLEQSGSPRIKKLIRRARSLEYDHDIVNFGETTNRVITKEGVIFGDIDIGSIVWDNPQSLQALHERYGIDLSLMETLAAKGVNVQLMETIIHELGHLYYFDLHQFKRHYIPQQMRENAPAFLQ
jgi:hypothetical protein